MIKIVILIFLPRRREALVFVGVDDRDGVDVVNKVGVVCVIGTADDCYH